MNDYDEEPNPVTRQPVPEAQRLAVVEKLFSIHFPLRIEPLVYGVTEKMTQGQYCGGYWNFFQLSNGGFYMAPEGDQVYQVSCDNYWQGELSADALGIVSCLYAYSHLSFNRYRDFARNCAKHYHQLREYMFTHSEVASILRAIN